MSTSLLEVADPPMRRMSATLPTEGEDAAAPADPGDTAVNQGLWQVPDIGRLAIFNVLMIVGLGLPMQFCIPAYVSEVMEDDAAAFLSWIHAAAHATTVVGAIYLGKLSDRLSRKRVVILAMAVGWLPSFLMLCIADKKATVVVWAVCSIVLAPLSFAMGAQPVVAAWWADKLLPEHRQVGFAVLTAIGILGGSVVSIGFVAIAEALTVPVPRASLWVSNACCILAFPVVLSTRNDPPRQNSPSEERSTIAESLLAPLRFIWSDWRIRTSVSVAAFITFSESAVGGISSILMFTLAGIAGEGHEDEQDMLMYYVSWGSLLLVPVLCVVGLLSKRFGSARVLVFWTPVASLMFSLPSLLAVANSPFTVIFGTLGLALPATLFLPLQVIVTHIAPANRVGEAMGSLGACQNMVALFAPLVMGVVMDYLEAEGRDDLYWVICPTLALFMLGSWPFCLRLAKADMDDKEPNLAQLSLQPVEGS